MNMGENVGTGRFLPWRYALFLILCLTVLPLLTMMPWQHAVLAGFDAAAIGFLATLPPLFHLGEAGMRARTRANDANRELILILSGIVMAAVLASIATELTQKQAPSALTSALVIATLALAWFFSNMVYALHYADLYYLEGGNGQDVGGIGFPGNQRPDYWDFTYFAFTLGMTFQTSDVEISSRSIRKVVIFHSIAAFAFNIGIIAFSINILGR